jgi:hypothetical protein
MAAHVLGARRIQTTTAKPLRRSKTQGNPSRDRAAPPGPVRGPALPGATRAPHRPVASSSSPVASRASSSSPAERERERVESIAISRPSGRGLLAHRQFHPSRLQTVSARLSKVDSALHEVEAGNLPVKSSERLTQAFVGDRRRHLIVQASR